MPNKGPTVIGVGRVITPPLDIVTTPGTVVHRNCKSCVGKGVGQALCGESTTNQDCNQQQPQPGRTAKPVQTLGKDDRVLNYGL